MDREEARRLPTVMIFRRLGSYLVSGEVLHALVRTGAWPTPVLRLGKLIRIPTAPLLELLGERRSPVA